MDLFGKKAQQERDELAQELAETQEALEETEQALQRYKDRFQDAETAKQEAQKKRKQAEQRLQNLQQEDDAQDTGTAPDVLSVGEMDPVITGVQDTTFARAHAYTAYLPEDRAVIGDRDEIIFFDPFTTGVLLHPPLPVDRETTSARSFQLDQLQDLIHGTYCYIHVAENGSGAAIIKDRSITDHVLVPDGDAADVTDAATELMEDVSTDAVLMSGDAEQADTVADQFDEPVERCTTKVAAVTQKVDIERAFQTAFTVECRRLTDDDIEQIRDALF